MGLLGIYNRRIPPTPFYISPQNFPIVLKALRGMYAVLDISGHSEHEGRILYDRVFGWILRPDEGIEDYQISPDWYVKSLHR